MSEEKPEDKHKLKQGKNMGDGIPYRVNKKDSIKPKKGRTADTAICIIFYDMEPATPDSQDNWTGVLTWKKGGLNKIRFYGRTLTPVVKQVHDCIRTVIAAKKGDIESVDIIFRMPSHKDKQTTIKYQQEAKYLI